ncbi:MAG: ABC transporter permease, partial [Chloroflexi bacterium]|nr:ABC transporter permease [Chloroflexota bacterium]
MNIVDIAIKDLLQNIRDKKSALFLVIMPIMFTLFFGFVFNPANQPDDTRLPVAVINQDQGTA